MSKPILQLRGVLKKYGATLGVGPVDFDVEESEFLTLLGPSGCGKTTTLHIIAGLMFPNSGTVTLGGREITGLDPQHRDMGLVFQNYALFPHKSIFDNVAFGLRMRKVARDDIRERVIAMLELVGLPGVDGRYPDQLSGGQRQRVALARALVIEPTLLLLDEPLSNLDAVLRKRMRIDLRDLQQRLGIATVFVTHDQDEAFEMSDRVVLLNEGHIEQIGAPEELYDNPVTRFAAEFIGDTNLIAGTVAALNGAKVTVDASLGKRHEGQAVAGEFEIGDRVYLMVRPERVEVALEHGTEASGIEAAVTKRVFSGDLISFRLRTTSGDELVCTKPSLPRYRDIPADATVWVSLPDCRVLRRED